MSEFSAKIDVVNFQVGVQKKRYRELQGVLQRDPREWLTVISHDLADVRWLTGVPTTRFELSYVGV